MAKHLNASLTRFTKKNDKHWVRWNRMDCTQREGKKTTGKKSGDKELTQCERQYDVTHPFKWGIQQIILLNCFGYIYTRCFFIIIRNQ